MRKYLMGLLMVAMAGGATAQTLEKMTWFN